MMKITVTRNNWTTKITEVAGDKIAFENISEALHKAQRNNKIKWYRAELYK